MLASTSYIGGVSEKDGDSLITKYGESELPPDSEYTALLGS